MSSQGKSLNFVKAEMSRRCHSERCFATEFPWRSITFIRCVLVGDCLCFHGASRFVHCASHCAFTAHTLPADGLLRSSLALLIKCLFAYLSFLLFMKLRWTRHKRIASTMIAVTAPYSRHKSEVKQVKIEIQWHLWERRTIFVKAPLTITAFARRPLGASTELLRHCWRP